MIDLKQYKKRRKQLKADIRIAKAHLDDLKQQLHCLREDQQHSAVDELDTLAAPRIRFFENLKRLIKS